LCPKKNGFDVTGATAYVTLEPCCHHGKTPPCTNSLIDAKIAQVIVAMQDPNPLVAGQGLDALRLAGIDVRCGLLDKEASELNIGFIHRMNTGLPWVRMKIAASLDGITALSNGTSQWITSSEARHDGHHWRARACCVLTGIGTAKEDNPQLNVRGIDTPRQPIRVLIDSFLEIPLNAKILDGSLGGHTLVFCGAVASHHFELMEKELRTRNVSVVQLPDHSNLQGKVDLKAVLRYLGEKLHINEVHIEAGFKLNGSFLREDCVNELLIYMAPRLIGPGSSMANLPELAHLEQPAHWEFIDQILVGDDLRLRLQKKVH
jgi:diaminohydroxyphosphoribosylaminopyrimidine deaminase/5-amino-6-(5-phosphoribosylamino)uracil reductase